MDISASKLVLVMTNYSPSPTMATFEMVKHEENLPEPQGPLPMHNMQGDLVSASD